MRPPVVGVFRDKLDLATTLTGGAGMIGHAIAWYRTAPPEQVGVASGFALSAFLVLLGFYRSAHSLSKQLHALETALPNLKLVRGPETHPDYLYIVKMPEYQARYHRVGLMNTGGRDCEARTVLEASSCEMGNLIFGEPLRVKGSVGGADGTFSEATTVHVSDAPTRHVDVVTEKASADGKKGGPLLISYTKHGQKELEGVPLAFALQLRSDGGGVPARIVLDCYRLAGSGLISVEVSEQVPVVPSKTPYCLRVPKAPSAPRQT